MRLPGRLTLAAGAYANRTGEELNYHYNNMLGDKQLYVLKKRTTLI